MKKPIYVCGYPKSGTTYLTRLIAEILNSSIGGSVASEDTKELAVIERNGKYIVRKGHYRIVDTYQANSHTITLDMICNNPTFFIVRDPRDIVVSAAYYHSKSFDNIADGMIDGSLYGLGRWDEYVRFWLDLASNNYVNHFVSYERLLEFTVNNLLITFVSSDLPFILEKIEQSIQNQSFQNTKKRFAGNPLNNKLMRKGIVGDWKNELSKHTINRIEKEFGGTMEWLGYE